MKHFAISVLLIGLICTTVRAQFVSRKDTDRQRIQQLEKDLLIATLRANVEHYEFNRDIKELKKQVDSLKNRTFTLAPSIEPFYPGTGTVIDPGFWNGKFYVDTLSTIYVGSRPTRTVVIDTAYLLSHGWSYKKPKK